MEKTRRRSWITLPEHPAGQQECVEVQKILCGQSTSLSAKKSESHENYMPKKKLQAKEKVIREIILLLKSILGNRLLHEYNTATMLPI